MMKQQNIICELCATDEDGTQFHLLQCEYFIENCETLSNNIQVEYEDIFESIDKQVFAAKLLHEVWEKRKNLTNNL